MRAFADEEWKRALLTLNSGTKLIESDPDSAASRAYYSAFHALTALFALRNQTFTKHSAIRSALHRDIINTGEWEEKLGKNYDYLMDLCETGDYGEIMHVSFDNAKEALEKAKSIITAVRKSHPEVDSYKPPG